PVECHGNAARRGKAQRSPLTTLCPCCNPSVGDPGFIKMACILFQALRRLDAPSEMHQGGLLAFSEDEGMVFPVLPGAKVDGCCVFFCNEEAHCLRKELL